MTWLQRFLESERARAEWLYEQVRLLEQRVTLLRDAQASDEELQAARQVLATYQRAHHDTEVALHDIEKRNEA